MKWEQNVRAPGTHKNSIKMKSNWNHRANRKIKKANLDEESVSQIKKEENADLHKHVSKKIMTTQE